MKNSQFTTLSNYSGIFFGLIFLSFVGYCTVNGFRLFVLASGSMEPALSPGTLILTQPQQKYLPGEVITFQRSSERADKSKQLIVTHRVIATKRLDQTYLYLTKGDANQEIDPIQVYHHQVIGKVVFALPLVGLILVWPYSRLGFYMLVVLPAVIIIGYLVKHIIFLLTAGS
jgi:signal peptidase